MERDRPVSNKLPMPAASPVETASSPVETAAAPVETTAAAEAAKATAAAEAPGVKASTPKAAATSTSHESAGAETGPIVGLVPRPKVMVAAEVSEVGSAVDEPG